MTRTAFLIVALVTGGWTAAQGLSPLNLTAWSWEDLIVVVVPDIRQNEWFGAIDNQPSMVILNHYGQVKWSTYGAGGVEQVNLTGDQRPQLLVQSSWDSISRSWQAASVLALRPDDVRTSADEGEVIVLATVATTGLHLEVLDLDSDGLIEFVVDTQLIAEDEMVFLPYCCAPFLPLAYEWADGGLVERTVQLIPERLRALMNEDKSAVEANRNSGDDVARRGPVLRFLVTTWMLTPDMAEATYYWLRTVLPVEDQAWLDRAFAWTSTFATTEKTLP